MRKATTVGPHAANGRRIFQARRRKGLTQTQLGGAAGITYRQIIRLENGEHLPSGGVRDAIAQALDLDPASLRSGDDDQEAAPTGDPFRNGSRRGAPRTRQGTKSGENARPAAVVKDAA